MNFEKLFSPRGVAVIGASQNPSKLGYGVARNLVVSGYPGELYFVNPHGGELFDRPMYPSILAVPDPLDLAVIMIPAPSVPAALEECGRRGVGFAIVGAGGFRETGEAGLTLERQTLEVARRHSLRVLGPNCIGFLDTHMPIDTSFLPLPGPIPGDIAFLSHSGAICEAVIDWSRGQGFGLSRLVSLGNQMDLTEGDLLPPVAADPNTRVIAMYIEGVGEGREFIRQAQQVTPVKPVLAIKVGQSEAGRAAVASHTGALAGEDAAYEAAFRKAGVIRARHSEEMFDWARALAWCPLPAGPHMAVLTNAGGPGAIAADALEANGLQLSTLDPETITGLKTLLPAAASTRNPVDMLAGAGPREYTDCLRLLLEDRGVDGVMVILPPPPMSTAADVAGAMIPLIRAARKPVVIALMGEDLIANAATLFQGARIPDYRFPERAASALRVLWLRGQQISEKADRAVIVKGVQKKVVAGLLKRAETGTEGFTAGTLGTAAVRAYGISTPDEIAAHETEGAVAAAREIGFPVVLKVDSPWLPHRTDIGGVRLGLQTEEEVRTAFENLLALREVVPGAGFAVLVQEEMPPGVEVIVGLVMFGSGGVEVEAHHDVAFALTPLTRREAENLLDATWAGRRLQAGRGRPASDRAAVLEVVFRLGQLADDFAEISEIEINPLRVMPDGEGASALDVRMRLNNKYPE
jgi:acetyl coenzyme A synthetase (ADP forming)-like protein